MGVLENALAKGFLFVGGKAFRKAGAGAVPSGKPFRSKEVIPAGLRLFYGRGVECDGGFVFGSCAASSSDMESGGEHGDTRCR